MVSPFGTTWPRGGGSNSGNNIRPTFSQSFLLISPIGKQYTQTIPSEIASAVSSCDTPAHGCMALVTKKPTGKNGHDRCIVATMRMQAFLHSQARKRRSSGLPEGEAPTGGIPEASLCAYPHWPLLGRCPPRNVQVMGVRLPSAGVRRDVYAANLSEHVPRICPSTSARGFENARTVCAEGPVRRAVLSGRAGVMTPIGGCPDGITGWAT